MYNTIAVRGNDELASRGALRICLEQGINSAKMKDFSRASMAEYKRLTKANLIVIDDVMLFPVDKNHELSALFDTLGYEVVTKANENPSSLGGTSRIRQVLGLFQNKPAVKLERRASNNNEITIL